MAWGTGVREMDRRLPVRRTRKSTLSDLTGPQAGFVRTPIDLARVLRGIAMRIGRCGRATRCDSGPVVVAPALRDTKTEPQVPFMTDGCGTLAICTGGQRYCVSFGCDSDRPTQADRDYPTSTCRPGCRAGTTRIPVVGRQRARKRPPSGRRMPGLSRVRPSRPGGDPVHWIGRWCCSERPAGGLQSYSAGPARTACLRDSRSACLSSILSNSPSCGGPTLKRHRAGNAHGNCFRRVHP